MAENMKFKHLSQGDTVDIIAPSSKGSTLDGIAKYIEDMGLTPRIASDIYSDEDIFYANTNEYRAQAFKDALLSEDSKAIWCIRGGKGATEIIPYLEGRVEGFEGLPSTLPNEKLLIGFSDITALHLYLQYKYGFPTIHGPVLGQAVFEKISDQSIEEIKNLIMGETNHFDYDLTKVGDYHNNKNISGQLIGGNLSLVATGMGSDWQIDTKDKIVFLEDVNGASYQVERYLDSLLQGHAFDDAQAVILCDFVKMAEDELIPQIRERFAEKIGIPVFHLEGVGHSETNHPMIYGIEYNIADSHLTASLV